MTYAEWLDGPLKRRVEVPLIESPPDRWKALREGSIRDRVTALRDMAEAGKTVPPSTIVRQLMEDALKALPPEPRTDDVPEGTLLADGFDHALLGFIERCGQPPIAIYEAELVIAGLAKDDMTPDEAEEHFAFNVVGAWVGEGTPGFLFRVDTSGR